MNAIAFRGIKLYVVNYVNNSVMEGDWEVWVVSTSPLRPLKEMGDYIDGHFYGREHSWGVRSYEELPELLRGFLEERGLINGQLSYQESSWGCKILNRNPSFNKAWEWWK